MKRFLLSLVALLISISGAKATHLMGGDITMMDLGNNTYLVTLITYRDTSGIPMATSAQFDFSGPNNLSFSTTTPYDSIISGNLLPTYPYGTEIYLFMDTVTLPAHGLWTVSWSNCCRNGAIQNLSNPLSESMWLTTSLVTDSASSNSTPFFLVPAAIYLPVNTPWQYNPLPFDPDGDSLHWSIDVPLSAANQACAGYIAPSSDTSNVFSIDPITGTISWTADLMGNFVASILVEQYRNGVWVGEIRRDMQFIVVNPTQGVPSWANLGSLPIDVNGNYSFNLVAGQGFNLQMLAEHSDNTRNLYLAAYSEVFEIPNSNASFVQTKSSQAAGAFTWQPTPADIRTEPYTVVFRVSDRYFTDDKTVLLNVTTALNQPELENQIEFSAFPNPATDKVFVQLDTETNREVSLQIFSLNGQQILHTKELKATSGVNLFGVDTSGWQAGMYIIHINGENNLSARQMIVIE